MTVRVSRVPVVRYGDASPPGRSDQVVVEEPLQVHVEVAGVRTLLGSTMRTPGDDLDLAVGLAVGEGVVRTRDDVLAVRHCAPEGGGAMDNDVAVVLTPGVAVPEGLGRVTRPSSACGVCGRDEIDALLARLRPVPAGPEVPVDLVAALPDLMAARQSVFRRTGGLHAAGLADAGGRLLTVREDVGRHNAVDKVIGDALLRALPGVVLVVSGRAGFEIVQKAAMAAIPIVAAVSAPTSLAVDVARECGLTLAAFVRAGRVSVYAGADRLVDTAA